MRNHLRLFLLFLLLFSFVFLFLPKSVFAAATYYVSTTGNDSYTTAQAQNLTTPWKTIQKCLNSVYPGDTCKIGNGTYNEALTLKTSGNSTGVITIKKMNDSDTVTVNSGNARTLVTSGNINNYTVDGLRFITTVSPSGTADAGNTDASVNFAYNYWGDGQFGEKGNDGFILRNCYVEGAVYFWGSDNLVENCEINGKNTWWNGLIERSQPSENNIFRNNIIHNFKGRGGWSLQMTDNSLWEGNTVYQNGQFGIDCDGAGRPVNRCYVKNNTIYDITGEGVGIILESTFNSIIEANRIYNVVQGMEIINYGPPISGDGIEHRTENTNTIIRNNLIYNTSGDGIICKASPGGKALNNTIYNTRQSPGYWAGIAMVGYDGFYCHNWEIKNNIVSQSAKYALWAESDSAGLTNHLSDYNFYDFGATENKIASKIGVTVTNINIATWRSKGYDEHSVLGNSPQFVNVAAGDFHLQVNSPACGMGAFPCGIIQTPTPTPTCIPQCTGKSCGSDGCGGGCGSCTIGQSCISNQCVAPTPTPTNTPTPKPTNTPTLTPTNTPTPTGPQKYYVSTTGSDSYTTTQVQNISTPWKTIQKCLDNITAGSNCEIMGGTYNESLTLKTSGAPTARITLKNYNNQTVTVNSGSLKTLVTGGRVDYYTIDGLRFIANFTPIDQSDVSIDLGKNVPFSTTNNTYGNQGFVLKNCYIEGAIHFYGHNNLVDNCELNGKNIWSNGVIDNFAASYNNTYKNNTIYDFIVRGIWTMNATDNILIEGNTIHNVRNGIDCDGAGVPINRCQVINNRIYNNGIDQWGTSIFLEDCFNCQIQGNIVHDIQTGPGIFVMNYGNGSASVSGNWHTFNNIEYRNQNTNTNIIDNVIYNYNTDAGMSIKAVNGLTIDHNTIYHTGTRPAIGFSSDKDDAGVIYCSQNETMTNNILFKNGATWFCTTTTNTIAGNYTVNPLFVNPPGDLHLQASSPACTSGVNGTYVGAYACESVTPTPTPLATIAAPVGSCVNGTLVFTWPNQNGATDYWVQAYDTNTPQTWYTNGWTGRTSPTIDLPTVPPGTVVQARVKWTNDQASPYVHQSDFSLEGSGFCPVPTPTTTPTPTPTSTPTLTPSPSPKPTNTPTPIPTPTNTSTPTPKPTNTPTPTPTNTPTSTKAPTPTPTPSGPQTYYVSPTGSDSNDGKTKATAFGTITKALSLVKAGGIVFLAGGIYDLNSYPNNNLSGMKFTNSGTIDAPITLTNIPGEQAILKTTNVDNNYRPIYCSHNTNDLTYPLLTKADYIKIIGTNVTPSPLPNGIISNKGLVFLGVAGAQWAALAVHNCDHWEVAGVDFVETGYGIFAWKNNNQTMNENSTDNWYVHDNRVYSYYRENGMQFNGDYNRVENNEIYRVNSQVASPYGCHHINILGDHNIIRGNTVSRAGSTMRCGGIEMEWDLADYNTIENNNISDVITGINIAGGDNNVVSGNIIQAPAQPDAWSGGIEINAFENPDVNNNGIYPETPGDWPCNELDPNGTAVGILPPDNPTHPDYQYFYNPRDCRSYNNQILGNSIFGFSMGVKLYKDVPPNSIFQNNVITGWTRGEICWYDGATGKCKPFPSTTQPVSSPTPTIIPTITLTPTPACIPQCTGKSCGGDGCGGSCGSCSVNENCIVYQCVAPTPTPTRTPTPIPPTNTPIPTRTPTPIPTRTPTPIPPTNTPTTTRTPTPTSTPIPPTPMLTIPPTNAIYYVSTTGNDSDSIPGTLTQPWLTIQKAVKKVVAGDTIYVRGGDYNGVPNGWVFQNSGTESKPITFSNYPGEQVVLKFIAADRIDRNIFGCASYVKDHPTWQTPKADYIHIIGTDVASRLLSDGVESKKGIVMQGMVAEQSAGIIAGDCDYWEVAGVDFVEVSSGIFTFKDNWGTMEEHSTDHWYVHDNRVYTFYRESGMQFNGDDNRIENNEIYKVTNRVDTPYGCQHFNFLGDHNIIKGNTLSRSGSTAGCAGILFEWDLSDMNTVEQNRISDVTQGIDIEGGDNNVIRNNIIYATGTPNPWAGGIEIKSYDNSVKTDWPCNETTGSALAILPAENPAHPDYQYYFNPRNCHSYGNQIYNNTIHGFVEGIRLYQLVGENSIIRNNVFSGWTRGSICFYKASDGTCKPLPAEVTSDHNTDQGNFGFMNLSNYDFHLSSNSPLINQGYNLGSLVPNDYDGVARPQGSGYDIGAYEYQGTPVIPTPTCIPNCTGKSCGDDGCGGSCGSCTIGQSCISNQCVAPTPTPTLIPTNTPTPTRTPTPTSTPIPPTPTNTPTPTPIPPTNTPTPTRTPTPIPTNTPTPIPPTHTPTPTRTPTPIPPTNIPTPIPTNTPIPVPTSTPIPIPSPTLTPTPACIPQCVAKACGDDGCWGLCGSCSFGESCENYLCTQPPTPTTVPTTTPITVATETPIPSPTPTPTPPVCSPNCDGKACGDDSCGGSCGACNLNESCNNQFACFVGEPVPTNTPTLAPPTSTPVPPTNALSETPVPTNTPVIQATVVPTPTFYPPIFPTPILVLTPSQTTTRLHPPSTKKITPVPTTFAIPESTSPLSLYSCRPDCTLTTWVYLQSKNVDSPYVLAKYGSSPFQSEYLLTYNRDLDALQFYVVSGNEETNVTAFSFASPPLYSWFFVAAWYDSGQKTINIQVDDGPVDSHSWGKPINVTTTSLTIAGHNFKGYVYKPNFWDTVLTAEKKQLLYTEDKSKYQKQESFITRMFIIWQNALDRMSRLFR